LAQRLLRNRYAKVAVDEANASLGTPHGNVLDGALRRGATEPIHEVLIHPVVTGPGRASPNR